jgi:uncharacterized protein YecT (DUF1311 family)
METNMNTRNIRASFASILACTALMFPIGLAKADPTMECSIGKSSQVEIGNCLVTVEKNAEAAMESALRFASSSATELDKAAGRDLASPALQAGQAAWQQYREKHCEFVGATFGGGSGTGIAIQGCRIELARERYAQLMQFAQ